MIILPSTPSPRSVTPRLIDFGFLQRPATGSPATRIDRPGMRMAAEFQMPPMRAETARAFISRLLRAASEGIRIPFPLSGVSQGSPGSTVVDGSGAAGTSLPVRAATAGYLVKEGYWLNVVDSDGVHYLHNVAADVTLSGAGAGTISVWPPLRTPLVDGNLIVLDTPKIEGAVPEPPAWPAPHTKIIEFGFVVEETA